MAPPCATVVVGAGPAGLLFCLVASIRSPTAVPTIHLVDKRRSYERTHRLRMDPAPYLAEQQRLDHPRFDALIRFLETEKFRPTANLLEQKLEALVAETGIQKQQRSVGGGQEDDDLIDLRSGLVARGLLAPSGRLVVVGADSVKSSVRQLVAPEHQRVEQVHQTVARLRIDGTNLPASLDPISTFKVAKLLGSAIDYRVNQNGFAELDLFLSPEEHRAVEALGARPAEPVQLHPGVVDRSAAPLFASLVDHLRADLTIAPTAISLYSTFKLEHAYQEQVAFVDPPDSVSPTAVFLVGDAAVSLPFFRGMACLMACVSDLAFVHGGLVRANGDLTGGTSELQQAATAYNDSVERTRNREVATVKKRARLVGLAREAVRVSAMAPFPIQSWLLSVQQPPAMETPAPQLSGRLIGTAVLAILAGVLAVFGPTIGLVPLLSVPAQAAAGALYRSDRDLPSPNRMIAAVCRLQILALLLAGAWIAIFNPFDSGWWVRGGAAIGWWVLGLVFIVGMYAFEFSRSRRANQSTR